MSDTTNFIFRVHHVPADQLHAFCEGVAAAFAGREEDWGIDWSFRSESDEDRLAEMLAITDENTADFTDEARVGTIMEADLPALVEAAPGAVWECWEDPKYEWLGEWAGHHPTTGLVGPVECDADGAEVANASMVRTALIAYAHHHERDTIDVDQLLAAVFPQEAFNKAVGE